MAWNSYFDHALAWDKHMDEENIMIITYEELKEVSLLEIKIFVLDIHFSVACSYGGNLLQHSPIQATSICANRHLWGGARKEQVTKKCIIIS